MATDKRTACWQALMTHQQTLAGNDTRMDALFRQNPRRAEEFSLTLDTLTFDFSKNLITDETLAHLLTLAEASNLGAAINDLFAGTNINNTENRPALHVALRGHNPEQLPAAAQAVTTCLEQMQNFVDSIHDGSWTGHTGKRITDVINIGIGGSDLGPAMVVEALRPWQVEGLQCHFVSNVDPNHLHNTLASLNPETTLFIVASKSFSTLETLENAILARRWHLDNGGNQQSLSRHFVAVSSNIPKARDFGIAAENVFPLWDWVGGRYSLWSAIGLVIALAVGMPGFHELLAGARKADEHFRQTALAENIPVIMALLTVWYSHCWQADSHVVLPYWQNLHLFPAFLQQLEMESLGKQVQRDGQPVTQDTGIILWGSAGTNGQHSFHQLLHQGTRLIPADFIAVAKPLQSADMQQHAHLLANCFSQSQALMQGRSQSQVHEELTATGMPGGEAAELAAHKAMPGNRPSNTFLLQQLDPATLGQLIALYEHRVFVQSVLFDINPFDQWGVELGKQLSSKLYLALNSRDNETLAASLAETDPSTRELIRRTRATWEQH